MSILLLISAIFQIGNWVETTSLEGNFKVSTPGEMVHKQIAKDTPVGELIYHSIFFSGTEDDDNLLYMVSWVDYPKGSLHSDSLALVENLMDATIETAVLNVDGKLMYQAPENIQGFPGRYWRIDYNKGTAVIKSKAFVAGRRFYSLQVASTHKKNINHAVDRFFDSFKLLSNPKD